MDSNRGGPPLPRYSHPEWTRVGEQVGGPNFVTARALCAVTLNLSQMGACVLLTSLSLNNLAKYE
jgi:hypothetical protein